MCRNKGLHRYLLCTIGKGRYKVIQLKIIDLKFQIWKTLKRTTPSPKMRRGAGGGGSASFKTGSRLLSQVVASSAALGHQAALVPRPQDAIASILAGMNNVPTSVVSQAGVAGTVPGRQHLLYHTLVMDRDEKIN